jgi:hypothetical protein
VGRGRRDAAALAGGVAGVGGAAGLVQCGEGVEDFGDACGAVGFVFAGELGGELVGGEAGGWGGGEEVAEGLGLVGEGFGPGEF